MAGEHGPNRSLKLRDGWDGPAWGGGGRLVYEALDEDGDGDGEGHGANHHADHPFEEVGFQVGEVRLGGEMFIAAFQAA